MRKDEPSEVSAAKGLAPQSPSATLGNREFTGRLGNSGSMWLPSTDPESESS